MRRRAVLTSIAGAVVGSASLTSIAEARNSRHIDFDMFGVTPLTTVRGVNGSANPWVTHSSSRIRVDISGEVEIRIRGLVIAPGLTGAGVLVPENVVGTNPVATVRIAISWLVPGGVPVFALETGPLTLDPEGNLFARVEIPLELPEGAERPIVLVRAGAAPNAGGFIASSNFLEDFGESSKRLFGGK
jgi:hypothetical protein